MVSFSFCAVIFYFQMPFSKAKKASLFSYNLSKPSIFAEGIRNIWASSELQNDTMAIPSEPATMLGFQSMVARSSRVNMFL